MGASMMSSNGHRGNGRRRRPAAVSEINVTPFVDVMLVLLIIFMVSAPLLTIGYQVELPDANAPNLSQERDPVIISRTAAGDIIVNNTPGVTLDRLAGFLGGLADVSTETVIIVRGDQALSYQQFMEVIETLYAAGYQRLSLETQAVGAGQ